MDAIQLNFVFVLLQIVAAKQPNIIFILADDYGFRDIGYHGSEIKTPNLDKLADTGVKLENYYVQPICSPSRLQLLTGRYQIHLGLQHSIIWASQPYGMPLDTPTIAEKLHDVGYSTHAVGKWHVGFYKEEYLPTNRGFDSFYGYLTGSSGYYYHRRCDGELCGFDLRNNTTPVNLGKPAYSTHLFTDRVTDIINTHKANKPFFIYLPFQAVHSPLQVPASYIKPYAHIKDEARRIYAGMVSCMDEAVGNITQTLVNTGLMDNTIIVFSTDNGGDVTEGGNNWPLRGAKGTLWEGGIRGVGFVHSPLLSDKAKGSVSTGLIHITDWFPTLVGRAGGNLDEKSPLDGYDQWDMINGHPRTRRRELLHNIDPLYWRRGEPLYKDTFDSRRRAALRVDYWKIITGDPGKGRWIPPPTMDLMVEYGDQPMHPKKNVWLFDVDHDPEERYDVAHLFPEVVRRMLDKLTEYEQTALPCVYPAKDNQSDPQLHGGFWGPWQ